MAKKSSWAAFDDASQAIQSPMKVQQQQQSGGAGAALRRHLQKWHTEHSNSAVASARAMDLSISASTPNFQSNLDGPYAHPMTPVRTPHAGPARALVMELPPLPMASVPLNTLSESHYSSRANLTQSALLYPPCADESQPNFYSYPLWHHPRDQPIQASYSPRSIFQLTDQSTPRLWCSSNGAQQDGREEEDDVDEEEVIIPKKENKRGARSAPMPLPLPEERIITVEKVVEVIKRIEVYRTHAVPQLLHI